MLINKLVKAQPFSLFRLLYLRRKIKIIMENRTNQSIRKMRKNDVTKTFFETMKKVRQRNPLATQNDVIEQAVKSEAPRFYVTFENARRYISLMARKKQIPIVNKNKLEMYKEIYRRYIKRIRETSEHYRFVILERIIEEPAPSFYLDEETFKGIVYKTLRERRAIA